MTKFKDTSNKPQAKSKINSLNTVYQIYLLSDKYNSTDLHQIFTDVHQIFKFCSHSCKQMQNLTYKHLLSSSPMLCITGNLKENNQVKYCKHLNVNFK